MVIMIILKHFILNYTPNENKNKQIYLQTFCRACHPADSTCINFANLFVLLEANQITQEILKTIPPFLPLLNFHEIVFVSQYIIIIKIYNHTEKKTISSNKSLQQPHFITALHHNFSSVDRSSSSSRPLLFSLRSPTHGTPPAARRSALLPPKRKHTFHLYKTIFKHTFRSGKQQQTYTPRTIFS